MKGNGTEDGPWPSDTVTNVYANRLRTGLGVAQASGAWTNGFGYDLARRLTNGVFEAGSFGYMLPRCGARGIRPNKRIALQRADKGKGGKPGSTPRRN